MLGLNHTESSLKWPTQLLIRGLRFCFAPPEKSVTLADEGHLDQGGGVATDLWPAKARGITTPRPKTQPQTGRTRAPFPAH